jgi:hypothetical protein
MWTEGSGGCKTARCRANELAGYKVYGERVRYRERTSSQSIRLRSRRCDSTTVA